MFKLSASSTLHRSISPRLSFLWCSLTVKLPQLYYNASGSNTGAMMAVAIVTICFDRCFGTASDLATIVLSAACGWITST